MKLLDYIVIILIVFILAFVMLIGVDKMSAANVIGTPTHNDVPKKTATGWAIGHIPMYGASCYRNGIRQFPGKDYTISGAAIVSTFWDVSDILVCDYEF